MKCNHDVNSNETSILIDVKKKLMIFPPSYVGICKVCRKPFKFEKVNGEYVEIKR